MLHERTMGTKTMKTEAKASKTDVATLVGAVVAVALTIVMTPGRYDLAEVAIAVTISLVLAAFVLGRRGRTRLERLAVSSVGGIALLPIGAFVFELFARNAAGPKTHFWIWIIGSAVALMADRILSRKPVAPSV
jgi:hypothetical protein